MHHPHSQKSSLNTMKGTTLMTTHYSRAMYNMWLERWDIAEIDYKPIKTLSIHQCDDKVHDTIISQKPP